MAVLDTSAVVAFLTGEPGGPLVREVLEQPVASYLCAVNLAEVFDVLGRRTGDVDLVERQIDLLLHAGLDVVDADETLGRAAGQLRAECYRRRSRDVALADCFALATTIRLGGSLVTSDRSLAEVARSKAADVLLIPDSAGRLD